MKILAIGDPHGDIDKIKKFPLKAIDLILLTGDLGKAALARKMFFENINREKQGLSRINYSPSMQKNAFMESFTSTIDLIKYLSRFAPVYLVFGNVEYSRKDTLDFSRKINKKLPVLGDSLKLLGRVKILNNNLRFFHGIKIGGLNYFTDASWMREFNPENKEGLYGAMKETKKIRNILRKFKKIDILLCHQPPYGILDKINFKSAPKSWQGKHAGSKVILDYIKRKQPQYVFCGHIHEAKGEKQIGRTRVFNLGLTGYKIIEIK